MFDETIPEGSMKVSEFGALLKKGIKKHYEKQQSNHSVFNDYRVSI